MELNILARGTRPDAEIPMLVRNGLKADGFEVGALMPKKVSEKDLNGAIKIVSLGLAGILKRAVVPLDGFLAIKCHCKVIALEIHSQLMPGVGRDFSVRPLLLGASSIALCCPRLFWSHAQA